MAKEIYEDATILWGPHSFEDYANECAITFEIPAVECTNFGSAGWKAYEQGIPNSQASVAGFWDTGDSGVKDAALFAGEADGFNFTVTMTNPLAAGDVGYSFLTDRASYRPGMGAVGDIAAVNFDLVSRGRPLKTTCLHTAASISATGNGDGQNIGNVSATQSVYGLLQIGSVTGSPTLDVIIESATSDSWPGTDRVTFVQETSATDRDQRLSAAGAITAPWWRAKWTYGGTGSFSNVRIFIAIE